MCFSKFFDKSENNIIYIFYIADNIFERIFAYLLKNAKTKIKKEHKVQVII